MKILVREAEGPGGGGPASAQPAAGGAAPSEPAAPPAQTASPPGVEPATPPSGGNGSLLPPAASDSGEAAPGGEPKDKTEGEAKLEPPAPEPLDLAKLALPEGLKPDDPGLAKLTELLGDDKLSPQDRAQNLLNLYSDNIKSMSEGVAAKLHDNYTQINNRWRDEVKADPVIGGDKLPESLSVVAKALDTWGDGKALREALDLTGMGNNPHFLRFVHKMATELGEGRPAQGGTAADRKSMAQLFYGSNPAPQAGA